ncbi:hypothetical protein BJF79_22830 [Actinomadura sp. CNU-125]|uniref:hypothetical protein n=1 Tax=Actinomadura sp. CNU-125 TaxID=1904961 RepID=UPI0009618A8A|nr:hypothetical protein [Actinomadura sp. CNU-125]OLT12221.1 hypothetical protein BJF79_22830 [Actinomadura sp. CNU-125]
MGNVPTNGLTAETRELLALFREALDLPQAAATAEDADKRQRLRTDNTSRILAHLDYLVDDTNPNVGAVVRAMRKSLDRHPVDYVTKDGEAGR